MMRIGIYQGRAEGGTPSFRTGITSLALRPRVWSERESMFPVRKSFRMLGSALRCLLLLTAAEIG